MWRIRGAWWKVVYIGVGFTVVAGVNRGLFDDRTNPVAAIGSSLVGVAFYLVAARVFRGSDEPVLPPRAWWRMTSRPTAGFVLAALMLATLLYGAIVPHDIIPGMAFADATSTATSLVLVALYLHSSVRLVRDPPRREVPLPRWKPGAGLR